MSVTCTKCGESNSATSTECWNCEARLKPSVPTTQIAADDEPTGRTCPVCGEKNASSSAQCWSCEARLNSAASINDVSAGSTCPVCGEHNPLSSTKCWSCEASFSSSSSVDNGGQTDVYRGHGREVASAHDRTMMIARTRPRPEKAPTAVDVGIARKRTESTLGIPRKKKHSWARIILLIAVLGASAPYLYWLETNYAPGSRTFNRFLDEIDRKDYAKAISIVRAHAAKGNARAQLDLAAMIQNGHGTTADQAAAFKLYREAAAKGQPDAIEMVKKIDAYEKALAKRQ